MLKHLLLGLLAAAVLTAAIPETAFVVPEITGALLEIPDAESDDAESVSEVQKAAPAKVTAELISSSETAHAGQKASWGAGVMWRRRRAPRGCICYRGRNRVEYSGVEMWGSCHIRGLRGYHPC